MVVPSDFTLFISASHSLPSGMEGQIFSFYYIKWFKFGVFMQSFQSEKAKSVPDFLSQQRAKPRTKGYCGEAHFQSCSTQITDHFL